jgi:hypothetical protein
MTVWINRKQVIVTDESEFSIELTKLLKEDLLSTIKKGGESLDI